MKILIIGKFGQVGLSLQDEARQKKINYRSTSREMLDITNENAVNIFFEKNHDYDFVVNAAAYTNVDGAEENEKIARAENCDAVRYLAQACRQFDLPLIHISTDYVFDGKKKTGYDEEDAANPKNKYGLTKWEGEKALQNTWKKYIILRVSWVFSEYGKNFLKTILNLSEKKDCINVVCDQFGAPTSAKSIAVVIIEICKKLYTELNQEKYWGVYHYTDFPVTSWHQFAIHIVNTKYPDKHKELVSIESKDYKAIAKRPENSILNVRKIEKIFGLKQKLWSSEVERIVKLI